jgi:hypothetical protein
MHPDQAAWDVLEYANASAKPFAMVPCCVYARQFPTRRLRSGAAVTSYEDFVAWLQEQAGPSELSVDTLPIPGRATVLWRR